MLKVISVVDKVDTALDRLAKGVAKYHSNIDYQVLDVHPKRPSVEQLAAFELANKDADIIEWQYYRTAELLRTGYEIKAKQILVHNNPYSIDEQDWNKYDMVVGNNKDIYERLGGITNAPTAHIPLTVDTDFWTYKREWKPGNTVLMVANRIEGKKGILPVAQACKELGLRFVLVGAISDAAYAAEVIETGANFFEQVTDEELRDLYWEATVHVCNSQDNFESGTLPILEAMLCGTPVLTRSVGHVPELYNGENMVIHQGKPDDVKGIKKLLKGLFDNPKKLESLRSKGWDTAKTRSHERRAYMYQKLYRQVMWPDQKSVSVVMPVFGGINPDTFYAAIEQDYQNLEVIICEDGNPDITLLPQNNTGNRLVRYINKPSKGYGLAKQRNLGIIEATGEIIVFCDQRQLMAPDAVSEFVKNLAPKRWVYGNKGAKKDFVENFSAVHRDNLIHIGMFNERIDAYGGMSQEIRSRAKYNGFTIEYIESAKATPQGSSKNKHTKRQDIIRIKNMLWKMGMEL